MGAIENLLEDLKLSIIDTLKEAIKEEVSLHTADKWLDKKQLAEYWGVSTKWIENNLDEIPHSKTTPWRFKLSIVDKWRMGELVEEKQSNKVSISNYKRNNFKIGG